MPEYDYQQELTHIPVDKHSNVLIIGTADTRYMENSPMYMDDLVKVAERYGESSDLAKAFALAQGLGVEYIFLMNIQSHKAFLSIADVINQNDFAYIVPIGINLSETFYDTTNNRETTYYAYLMSRLDEFNDSVFVATDKHADLFEDMDAFIDYMNATSKEFVKNAPAKVNMENLILVANMLEDTYMANLFVAAALASTEICYYPTTPLPPVVLRIDHNDGVDGWAYFQEHTNRETMIESLMNSLIIGNPLKIVTISRIVKVIKRELDFSEFLGRQYTAYQLLLIGRKLERYLEQLTNYAIRDYDIESVKAYRGEPGTVTVICKFTILPINCDESISIERRIEIGL